MLATDSHQTPKLPKQLIWAVWLICVLPFTLNLLGVNFGSAQVPLNLEGVSGKANEVTEVIYHTLAGSFIHTILEWSAFCAAIFTVILAFAHFSIKYDVTTPIIGVTLLCAGLMDAFHTLAADRLIEVVADNRNLVPFTWALCRLCNVLLTIIGVSIFLAGKSKQWRGNLGFVILVSLGFGLLCYSIIHACASNQVLPQTIFPKSFVTRPWDIFPLILFLLAGILIYPRFYRKYPSLFSHGLIISSIPNAATQIHMAFGSTALFDNHFNIAHFLKIIAYLVPLAGLILDYIHTHRQQEQTNKNFLKEIRERQQTEAKLQKFTQREDLLRSRLSSQIGNSLELSIILKTAVCEIRDLLQIDYCSFCWYNPDATPPSWETVCEAKNPQSPHFLSMYSIEDVEPLVEKLLSQKILQVDEVKTLNEPALREFLLFKGFTCVLAQKLCTPSNTIGVLLCGRSTSLLPWQQEEVELLKEVREQLVIALNQAQLYTEACSNAQRTQQALLELQKTQSQLIQTEKMSALGNLVAGVAHEINNPVGFIAGNLIHISEYMQDLLNHLKLYQQHYPDSVPAICHDAKEIDLEFLLEDLPRMISSMQLGCDRISNISTSLRTFSRSDNSQKVPFNVHSGIDSTLLILKYRLKSNENRPAIQVIKEYGDLPNVECFPGQLNQVFMNILANAIDAFEETNLKCSFKDIQKNPNQIIIRTEMLADHSHVAIRIQDNGCGISKEIQQKIFDHLFTTKGVDKGTGLGLSIASQIVEEKHGGRLQCISNFGKGTEFIIEIPLQA
ncbi:ATP-binding protein [Nostoc sp. UHCC 0302]|uniref:ATP-binding protein n=1 Tax=Nostoc sp. UHCC 0302 TaxID=3134896 RepID=UPI00311CBACC